MATIMGNPLLRVLQGAKDVLYHTEDGIALVKFDRIEIEVDKNGSINIQFMKNGNLVMRTPFFGPLGPGQIAYFSVRGGIEADITV